MCSLPLQIGSNVSVERYNKFIDRKAPRGYKYHYENGDVFIIDMSSYEHSSLVHFLADYFKVYNGATPMRNKPIEISGDTRKNFIFLQSVRPIINF
jgi:Uma2 family endonuclease